MGVLTETSFHFSKQNKLTRDPRVNYTMEKKLWLVKQICRPSWLVGMITIKFKSFIHALVQQNDSVSSLSAMGVVREDWKML